jgi:uncharacterized protein
MIRGSKQLGVILIGLSLPMLAARAQPATPPAPSPAPIAAYTMPSTQMWDMASDSGDIYRIFVSFPAGEAPARGYPVLYVLDGNASFASFAETRRLLEYAEAGKAIIVGVGYPTDMPYDARRTGDFVEPWPHPTPTDPTRPAPPKTDGRGKFLDFLTGKLRSEIDRRYRIDPNRQSLFGHSFGGLFALHALYTRPQAFHSIVAASPSLEWNQFGSLREEREFTARLTDGKLGRTSRLMVVVGGRDVDDDPYPAESFVKRMELLSGHGLRTRFRRYEEEGHMTVPIRAVTDVLRFVFEQR